MKLFAPVSSRPTLCYWRQWTECVLTDWMDIILQNVHKVHLPGQIKHLMLITLRLTIIQI